MMETLVAIGFGYTRPRKFEKGVGGNAERETMFSFVLI